MDGQHKVRVSQFPDRELIVDAREFADLTAQNLIVKEDKPSHGANKETSKDQEGGQ